MTGTGRAKPRWHRRRRWRGHRQDRSGRVASRTLLHRPLLLSRPVMSFRSALLPTVRMAFRNIERRTGSIPASFRRHSSTGPSSTPPPANLRSTTVRTLVLSALAGATVAFFIWPDDYRGAPTVAHEPLSATHFTTVTVTATEHCGPSLKLLTLCVPPKCLPENVNSLALDPIWSIFVKDDDIQVERPYTPLEGIDSNGCIKLWVKKYQHGEVGRWLHTKEPGDKIEVRGPIRTLPTSNADWDEVVLVRRPFVVSLRRS
jgi:hypothetical protein